MDNLTRNERILLEFVSYSLLCGQMNQLFHMVDDDELGHITKNIIRYQSELFAGRNEMLMQEITKNSDYLNFLVKHTKYHEMIYDSENELYVLLPGCLEKRKDNELIQEKDFMTSLKIAAEKTLQHRHKDTQLSTKKRRSKGNKHNRRFLKVIK